MSEINAWKEDPSGRFIEMLAGTKKDYSIDWSAWLGTDTLAVSAWTLQDGVTKSDDVIAGKVSKVTIDAPTAGTYTGVCAITSGAGLKEKVPFRIIVE